METNATYNGIPAREMRWICDRLGLEVEIDDSDPIGSRERLLDHVKDLPPARHLAFLDECQRSIKRRRELKEFELAARVLHGERSDDLLGPDNLGIESYTYELLTEQAETWEEGAALYLADFVHRHGLSGIRTAEVPFPQKRDSRA